MSNIANRKDSGMIHASVKSLGCPYGGYMNSFVQDSKLLSAYEELS